MSAQTPIPAVFVGHGSPMNAILDNRFTQAWKSIGESLPRPRAIVVVSAHWATQGTAVTAMAKPRTIHDFGGFPRELYEIRYPVPGDPALAAEIARMLAPVAVRLDSSWGLEHAAWSVLLHAYPKADVPVLEVSIDLSKPPAFHMELGSRLAPLRDTGVLLLGSGNIVHNLQQINREPAPPPLWARRFDDYIGAALESGDDAALVNYGRHPDARLAAPDIEHFLPVLYIAGSRRKREKVRFIIEGFDLGSVSMRAFQV